MPRAIKPAQPIFACRPEAAGALGIGLNQLDEMIASGQIKAVKIGHRIKIAWTELQRFAEALPAVKSRKSA
jgi:excisionase family DNA binding protein